ncbi:MAG TPA: hypothetical protein VFS08_10615, partial [Gemmatimonadaceae bacterium]|nr:hypothetical protein [Gemmatimonadaceae bacterium]
VTTPGPATLTHEALYREIVAIDRAEGRVFDGGATSLAMAKAMRARGWCGEFRWGYTLEELVQALLAMGPVLMGTWWTDGMMEPDAEGVIRYRGARAGGHEYVVNGVNRARGMIRLKNSWGRGWSRKGFAWIPFEDVERLIADEGDVLIARELPPAR